jgi:2-polyprenyl-6-methoxyphenol hydroxylase-like FAD-dependent oxidoreductase
MRAEKEARSENGAGKRSMPDDVAAVQSQRPSLARTALAVQRAAGNASTVALLQRMMSVGPVDDPAEREADAFASQVEQTLRQPTSVHAAMERSAQPPLRRITTSPSTDGAQPAPDAVTEGIRDARGGGRPLPTWLRTPMEGALGVDLSSTRIHTDGRAGVMARSIQARAFTVGDDVFFGRGEFDPSSTDGRRVLAHEVAHVAQQAGSTARRTQVPTIRRLTDEQSEQLLGRAAKLNYNLLGEVAAKMPLLNAINQQGGDPIESEGLKQTVLTSTAPADKLQGLLGDPAKLRKKALEKRPRSSGEVFGLIDACRGISNDYYRFEGATPDASARQKLGGAAQAYDASQKKTHDLTHKGKGSGLLGSGLFSRTKSRTHTMEDVMAKVNAVAGVDLRMGMSPTNMPKTEGGGAPTRAKVGVVGAGPVGLMAALESRLQGVDVVLFEARADEYSRRQVLVLDKSTEQKLAKLGVKYELLDANKKGTGNTVAVKYIEKALRERCEELGVEIRTNWSLAGLKRDDGQAQTEATFQVGKDKRSMRVVKERLDLVVVAAGAGVAKANKFTGVCIGDELGIQYDVQEAKDYAAVGLFENTTQGNAKYSDRGDGTENWAYRFNTPKVTYVLRQIPQELFKEFTTEPDGRKKLEAFIRERAKNHFEMGDAALGKDMNKLKQRTPNIGVFPIEIQQARTFVNTQLNALVIGDSAATPHPQSGSGFNTGVRELDSLADVVAAVRTQVQAANDPKAKGGAVGKDEESPSQIKSALEKYNAEMKTLTDVMVGKAMRILAEQHGKFLKESIAALEKDAGSHLQSDYAMGRKVESIKNIAEKALAKDTTWSKDDTLDFLLQAQKDIAKIKADIASVRSSR